MQTEDKNNSKRLPQTLKIVKDLEDVCLKVLPFIPDQNTEVAVKSKRNLGSICCLRHYS